MAAAGSPPEQQRRLRVAVDVPVGQDVDPQAAVDAVLGAAGECDDVMVVLVATPDVAAAAQARGPGRDLMEILPATVALRGDHEPVREVRSSRGATVRVAARAVRDGRADAMVSFGPAAATVAAAAFTLDPIPGTTRPVLAATVSTPRGPLVLVDVSGSGGATADELVQAGLLGAALAQGRLGIDTPRVGLLTPPAAPSLAESLAALCGGTVTAVSGADVVRGGAADVVVVDGFTGAALLSALSAACPGSAVDAHVLGVAGAVVAGLGPATRTSVASGIASAAAAARHGAAGLAESALSDLVHARRAGLQHARAGRRGHAR